MINIQLFGGPGTGKSTTASGLFYKMKAKDYSVEYIQEFAKELSYGKDFTKLGDQLLILGEQHHRLHRLKDQVEYVIHDSPFVMGLSYLMDDEHVPKDIYTSLITTMYNSYNNINIFLERAEDLTYQEYGRSQSLEQAIEKDEQIKQILQDNGIEYITVKMGSKSIKKIMKIIKKMEKSNAIKV